jgi:ketosteroid isomerase-like protein
MVSIHTPTLVPVGFDPVDRLAHFHTAINALDFAAIEACFAADAIYSSSGIGTIKGRDAIMAAFRDYFAVYPDQSATDESIERISPSAASSRWRLSATHATTGARLERTGKETVTFDGTGLIAGVEVQDDWAVR